MSTVAACVAALAALCGLYLAKRTVDQGRLVLADAEQARHSSELARAEAERDRRRNQLLRVSDLNEQMFWEAEKEVDWRGTRNLLRHAAAGLALDGMDSVIGASTHGQAFSATSRLREMIAIELEQLQ